MKRLRSEIIEGNIYVAKTSEFKDGDYIFKARFNNGILSGSYLFEQYGNYSSFYKEGSFNGWNYYRDATDEEINAFELAERGGKVPKKKKNQEEFINLLF